MKNPDTRMSRLEFIGLMAMLFATIAFSIDAMLPALPEIAAELSEKNAHRAPLILTSFVLGMGIGTFFAGPLSDAYGRRTVIFVAGILYAGSAAVAWFSTSLEVMLMARVAQGVGASGPRVAAMAVVRDLYSGREMAKIVSTVMMIFTLVPAFAPLIGAGIISLAGWRAIYLAFILFSLLTMLWMALRLPETLHPDNRRPIRFSLIKAAIKEMLSNRTVRLSIIAQALCMSMLFATLLMVQPVYEQIYDRADSFPYWFAIVALAAGSASMLNAMLVMRLGMQSIVIIMLATQVLLSGTMIVFDLGALPEPYGFYAFLIWQISLFFQTGMLLGNLNAIAMEPLGHVAGMAASTIGSVATVAAAVIASPVGLAFNGTTLPLAQSIMLMALLALLVMLRLVRSHKVPSGAAP